MLFKTNYSPRLPEEAEARLGGWREVGRNRPHRSLRSLFCTASSLQDFVHKRARRAASRLCLTNTGPNRTFNKNISAQIAHNIWLFLFLLHAVPSPSFAGELQDTVQLGVHIGYSGTYIDPIVSPNIFDGFAVGAQVVFGLNNFIAVAWDAAFDWHPNYREYNYEEYENEDGELSMEWLPGSNIRRYFMSTTALSLVYALDVSRVAAYLTGGASGARVDRDADGVHEAKYGFGLRLGGGFDYYFSKFTLGAGITYDKYFIGNTDHDARFVFLIRISYLFRR